MIKLANPWVRLPLCAITFCLVFLVAFVSTVLLLYSNDELLLVYWVKGLDAFNLVGLFEYRSGGEEGLDEAVGNSLACLWIPASACLAWRLNSLLKERFSTKAEPQE